MFSNKPRMRKRLLWIGGIIGLLGACALLGLFGLNYLAWRIPSSPRTRSMALADLDGDGDRDAFAGDDRRGRIWLNDGQRVFRKRLAGCGRISSVPLGCFPNRAVFWPM